MLVRILEESEPARQGTTRFVNRDHRPRSARSATDGAIAILVKMAQRKKILWRQEAAFASKSIVVDGVGEGRDPENRPRALKEAAATGDGNA